MRIKKIIIFFLLVFTFTACSRKENQSETNTEDLSVLQEDETGWVDYSECFGSTREQLIATLKENDREVTESDTVTTSEIVNGKEIHVNFGRVSETMNSYVKTYMGAGNIEEDRDFAIMIFNKLLLMYGDPEEPYDSITYKPCDDWESFTEMIKVGDEVGVYERDRDGNYCRTIYFIWLEKELYYYIRLYEDDAESISIEVLFAHDGNWVYGNR